MTRAAFKAAQERKGHVTSVDKANVMETSRLWREVVSRIGREEFPDVELEHMLVDSAAMRLIQTPRAFDVILTENMFGDILSDEAAMLPGSIGLLGSASLGEAGPGLYEPIHGSAPRHRGPGQGQPGRRDRLGRHAGGFEIEAGREGAPLAAHHDRQHALRPPTIRPSPALSLRPAGRRRR